MVFFFSGVCGFVLVFLMVFLLPPGLFYITFSKNVGWSTHSGHWTDACPMRIDYFFYAHTLYPFTPPEDLALFLFLILTYLKSSSKHVAGMELLLNSAFD